MTTSTRSVGVALGVDLAIGVAKAIAFAVTGSAAIMAETLHSLADTTNQAFLAVGIARSRRQPNRRYPYGFGKAQYIWALLSATGVLFVGCGVSIVRGAQQVLTPEPLEHLGWGVAVLLLSLVLESMSLAVALAAVRRSARAESQSIWRYLYRGPDPMSVGVVLEDGSAVLGLLVASCCIALARATGDPVWDGLGSIVIGVLLGLTAAFLIKRNAHFLLGPSPSAEVVARMVAVLQQDPVIDRIDDVKVSRLGVEEVRFKAEVTFDGAELARRLTAKMSLDDAFAGLEDAQALEQLLIDFGARVVEAVGDEVDRIELELTRASPQALHVDLEPD